MTSSPDESCPVCGKEDTASNEATDGRFRLWCAMCAHSTDWHADLALARLKWIGSRDGESPG